MTDQKAATRRTFFVKAGTALSLPLAAGASGLHSPQAVGGHAAPAREAESIRRLQQGLAREINSATGRAAEIFATGTWPASVAGVSRLLPADFGEHDTVEIAADGLTARATIRCAVETKVPIAAEGTLIEMARAQGEGFVYTTACKTIDMVCVRRGGTWKIETLVLRDA